ncbi:antibiotic biosynthesis monooxygenase [Streptomyces sp900105245]|uniref:putative quinol monooxygenase n=1 Tax=Streptomyces sp. 900105245 TaxID=3154379 RepID=UPI00331A16EB
MPWWRVQAQGSAELLMPPGAAGTPSCCPGGAGWPARFFGFEHEPGTLVYACSEVEGAPNQRLFFELYADRAAFEAHGRQPHVQHFPSESKKHAEKTEIDHLRPYVGKYPSGAV